MELGMQELDAAESIFADICDEIEKAEKFFPVPESAQAWLDASAAAAATKGIATMSGELVVISPVTVHSPPESVLLKACLWVRVLISNFVNSCLTVSVMRRGDRHKTTRCCSQICKSGADPCSNCFLTVGAHFTLVCQAAARNCAL